MSSDCGKTSYSRFDWTPSFVEEDYDSSRSTSSTLSWNDETDKDAATKLKEHFERFEAALYSETNGDDLTDTERAECDIWKERFPHLRILGKRIVLKESQDENVDGLEYPSDYEEVIASHSSEPEKLEVNDEVVDRVCERVLPTVLKKIEEFSAEKLNTLAAKTSNELEVNGTSYPEKNVRSPTNRSSYLKVDDLKRLTSRKLDSFGFARKFPTISDDPKTTKRLDRVPKSARNKKKPFNEYESETVDKIATPPKSDRHGILPPIEALAITPNILNKRANSAMLRFSKTVPRVRPFTTRNKTMYLMPVKNGFVNDIQNKINPLIDEKNYASSLPPNSGYNRKLKLPPRWRY